MENRITLAENWFAKAESDLKNAELVFMAEADDKPFDTVCYHCQQAAEKYLKGFLIYLDTPFTKTHNIEVRMDLVSPSYPEIEKFTEAVSLTYYAVENRYPDDFVEVSEDEAINAFLIAKELKAFVIAQVTKHH